MNQSVSFVRFSQRRRFVRRRMGLALLLIGALMTASCSLYTVPDQSSFLPLPNATKSEAIVRLYAAPIPWISSFAVHCWFVVKRAGDDTFHRWELWQDAGGPYGHMRLDLGTAEGDVGGGPSFILAELRGTQAEPVVDFIESQSPSYSCRNEYVAFPGPNSNTYVQWVLNGAGWNIDLPWVAIGKDAAASCN